MGQHSRYEYPGINGYSTPALFKDDEGIHVLVGNETGTVQAFGIATTDFEVELLETNNEVIAAGNGGDGFRAGAAFADLNGDTIVDCLIGIQNGGLRCYISGDSSTSDIENHFNTFSNNTFNLFPNPGTDVLNWEFSVTNLHTSNLHSAHILVRNELGITVFTSPIHTLSSRITNGSISTLDWASGIYIVSIVENDNNGRGNLLRNRKGGPIGPPVRWIKLN